MLLELSEILACPACGPPQLMVAVVDQALGPVVESGFMACPACDARFPIAGGTLHLSASAAEGEAPAATAEGSSAPTDEVAVMVAALLGLERGSGHVLFGPGLASAAVAVAGRAERCSVISVSTDAPGPGAAVPNLSHVVVDPDGPLCLQPARLRGMALAGTDVASLMSAAAHVLAPGGRLVILEPGEDVPGSLAVAGFEIMASDRRACLAVRPLSERP